MEDQKSGNEEQPSLANGEHLTQQTTLSPQVEEDKNSVSGASDHSTSRISKDIQLMLAEIKEPKRRQLVHTARQMFETRWAKYNDPHNEEWDFDDITDKWERHAWSAYRDLVAVEKERDALLSIIETLQCGDGDGESATGCEFCDRPTAYFPADVEQGQWVHRGRDNEVEFCTNFHITQDAASASAPSTTAPDHGPASPSNEWVTFGRIKTDIENETETFERISPPESSESKTITQLREEEAVEISQLTSEVVDQEDQGS